MKKAKTPVSPTKFKHLPIVGVIIAMLGVIGVFLTRYTFMLSVKEAVTNDGTVPIAKDNFDLYFKLSLIMCTVLFVLSILSFLTHFLLKDTAGRFSKLTVTVTPILSVLALIVLSAFYAYLTHDKSFPTSVYLVILGISEGAVLLLPPSLYRLCISAVHKHSNKK